MLLSTATSILVGLLHLGTSLAQTTNGTSNSTCVPRLITYPIPSGVATASTFNVRVRSSGRGDWKTLGTYGVNVEVINTTTGSSATYVSSMAYFDFSGAVDVSVQYLSGPVSLAEIRPYSYGITPTAGENGTYQFTLAKPANVVFQVNGDIFHTLNLFGNPVEKNPPRADDPNVIYYGPGLHTVAGGVQYVNSSQTLYLAGGAALQADVVFQNSSNAAIRGRGIVYKSTNAITVAYGKNILVEGVTVVNPKYTSVLVGQSDGVTISNVRAFSATSYGDGIDLYSTKNAIIEKVFMRTSDDCIAIYNHRNDWWGDSTNITVKDSSLWADVAHPINLATHGNADDPETLSDLTISNIDILDHREMQMLYQGCIAFNPGDENTIRDVLVEDVKVENFRIGQLVNMRIMYNPKWNAAPGKLISNVTIRNLEYNGNHSNPSLLVGYDETRRIEFITFENLTINGQHIYDTMKKPSWYLTSDFVPMYANEHVANLTFLP